MDKESDNSNSEIDIEEQKEYLSFNIKGIFEHYQVEERIIKIQSDIIILDKMTNDVNNLINPLKKFPEYQQMIDSDKNKNLSKSPNLNKEQLRTNVFNKKSTPDKTKERALTIEVKKNDNKKKKVEPLELKNKINSLSKKKSVDNFSKNNKMINNLTKSIDNYKQPLTNKEKNKSVIKPSTASNNHNKSQTNNLQMKNQHVKGGVTSKSSINPLVKSSTEEEIENNNKQRPDKSALNNKQNASSKSKNKNQTNLKAKKTFQEKRPTTSKPTIDTKKDDKSLRPKTPLPVVCKTEENVNKEKKEDIKKPLTPLKLSKKKSKGQLSSRNKNNNKSDLNNERGILSSREQNNNKTLRNSALIKEKSKKDLGDDSTDNLSKKHGMCKSTISTNTNKSTKIAGKPVKSTVTTNKKDDNKPNTKLRAVKKTNTENISKPIKSVSTPNELNKKNSKGKFAKKGEIEKKSEEKENESDNEEREEEEQEENSIDKEILEAQKNKEINSEIKTEKFIFSSPYVEALYLTLNQNYFPIDKKIKLICQVPELYKQFPKRILLKELIAFYEKRFENLSKMLEGQDLIVINKLFTPSKTAQNGLNFITNEEVENLMKNPQPKEVIMLFTVLLILLNEDYKTIPNEKIIEYIFKKVFTEFNVDTLKHLFIQHIVQNCNFLSIEQIEKIDELIKENPVLISSSDMFRINRNISYMTFILKEIMQFIFLKTDDEKYYLTQLRNANIEMNALGSKIQSLKNYL